MKIDELWESSSKVSSQRDSVKKPKNRRWAPGIHKPTGVYNDCWTYWFLENMTPYETLEELFDSGDIVFDYERKQREYKRVIEHGDNDTFADNL